MDYFEVRRKLEQKISSTSSKGEQELFEVAKEAVDTQIGVKANKKEDGSYICSVCTEVLGKSLKFKPYCPACGQMASEE